MNTKIMNSLSSSLQDRRSMLESKTREPALRSLADQVKSKTESPPGSKGDGLFERELSRQTQPKEDDKRLTAKTDKTENLRSHSGAGTESRKTQTERRETRDQRAADRRIADTNSTTYQNRPTEENVSSTREDSREPNELSTSDIKNEKADEATVRDASPRLARSADGENKDVSVSSREVSEAPHSEEESDDDSIDGDAEQILVAANQSPKSMSIKDPKFLKQIQAQMEAGNESVVAASNGKQANAQVEGDAATKADFTPKQKAMLELLEGMQKELGVSPETMLKAFGDMSQASLEAPPEETLKDFIGKLTQEADLSPRETVKATALYGKFLGEHAQAEFDETLDGLKVAGAIQNGKLSSSILENLDQSVADLQVSLKQMQAGAQTPEQLQSEVARLMQLSQSLKAGEANGESGKILLGADSDDDETGLNDLSGDSLKDFTVQNDKKLETAVAGRSLDQNFGGQAGGQNGSAGSQNGQSNSHQAKGKASSTSLQVGSTGAKGSLRGEMEEALKAMNGDDVSTNANPAVANSTLPLKDQVAVLAGEGSALQAKMTPKDEEANVKELMRQAQLIVKKGGGEMKLEMSPEGMGKVHLKVGVENGQVNVQMLAESDAAKKMIENNLGDLRASLVAHKLHVNQLKVDTKVEANADVSKQMDQQTNGDASRDQSRQFARNFMSEFRDDREGFRQGFFGDPKTRGYGRQARSDVKPDAVATMSARKTGATRGLDLVA